MIVTLQACVLLELCVELVEELLVLDASLPLDELLLLTDELLPLEELLFADELLPMPDSSPEDELLELLSLIKPPIAATTGHRNAAMQRSG